jgi:hypothetical protein
MKTLITLSTVGLLALAQAEPSSVQRDPAMQVGDWVKLAARIKGVLPKEWILETSPFKDGSVAFEQKMGSGYRPMIVIYKPTPVSAIPKEGVSFLVRHQPFLICYELKPKMPEKDWQEQRTKIDQDERLRKWYEEQLALAGCPKRNTKADGPEKYIPSNEEQRRILREYLFVHGYTWNRELPDHWFASLAVSSHTNSGYVFQEKAVERKYTEVSRDVAKLLTPYAPPKTKAR